MNIRTSVVAAFLIPSLFAACATDPDLTSTDLEQVEAEPSPGDGGQVAGGAAAGGDAVAVADAAAVQAALPALMGVTEVELTQTVSCPNGVEAVQSDRAQVLLRDPIGTGFTVDVGRDCTIAANGTGVDAAIVDFATAPAACNLALDGGATAQVQLRGGSGAVGQQGLFLQVRGSLLLEGVDNTGVRQQFTCGVEWLLAD